jgi:hypothetical protein
MKLILTRQNFDGTYDEVGMNNRTVISGYKTMRNAIKYRVLPFSLGRPVRVEEYGDWMPDTPRDVFVVHPH